MLTYKTFRDIAIDYAYDRGSAIPLQADEACNAIVDYINEQLQNIVSEVAKNEICNNKGLTCSSCS